MLDRITEQPFCQTRVSGSTFINADCFDVFPFIDDKSIDAIICDLPYGTTQIKWDTILPFDKLWEQYERIIKPNGAIILTASQPFTSALVMSNPKLFRYEWIYEKGQGTNYALSKKQPIKNHENILVFYKSQPTYNPIMVSKSDETLKRAKRNHYSNDIDSEHKTILVRRGDCDNNEMGYPKTVQYFKGERNNQFKTNVFHPTQKPVLLMEYLIKTYTNEGDMVLDNCMGSGTTNLACIKLNRKSIGIEKEKQYYDVAVRRASEYCH